MGLGLKFNQKKLTNKISHYAEKLKKEGLKIQNYQDILKDPDLC